MRNKAVSLLAVAMACALVALTTAHAQLAPTTQPRPGNRARTQACSTLTACAVCVGRSPGQDMTAGYMALTASGAPRKLVGVSTSAAGSAELHEMKMDGDVMRMRAVDAIELPAGQTVELKPGGLHLMLMDLKTPLARNTSMPLTLTFEDAQGNRTHEEMKVPVLDQPPPDRPTGPGRGAAR